MAGKAGQKRRTVRKTRAKLGELLRRAKEGRRFRQVFSVAGIKGRAESSAPSQRLKTPAAGPGNSGILGRSEQQCCSGFGSRRYIPVNLLLKKPRLWESANLNQPKLLNAVSGQQSGKTPTSRTGKYPGPMPKHPSGLAQPILEILQPAGLPESLTTYSAVCGVLLQQQALRGLSTIRGFV